MSANRGEWSETYGVLLLLVKPKLNIVDSSLKKITDEIFTVKEIILNSKIQMKYKIIDNTIIVYADEEEYKKYTQEEINDVRKTLLFEIKKYHETKGSFEVKSLSDFLSVFTNKQQIKAKSSSKEDILTIVLDNKKGVEKQLSYSIKSMLGNPATLLNASQLTNFSYIVTGLNKEKVDIINKIDTKTKLIDRIKKIYELGGNIEYSDIPCDNLKYNFKMIDSCMPQYIGNTLLQFYKSDSVDKSTLKNLFIKSNNFDDDAIGMKKLGDFLLASSFGFFPNKKWDGRKSVTGGILIIDKIGNGLVLDLVYYESEVRDYLIKQTKLDTPSTTRYKQLELKDIGDNKFGFTLNLQVRYRK